MNAASIHRSQWVLVDTSAYYALGTHRDSRHAQARAIASRLATERWRLFTTNLILAETHALLLNRLNRAVAWRFLMDIDQGSTTVVRVTPSDEQRARAIILQYDDKDFSLTDSTSFAVMERLGIPTAFSFDRNFTQFGIRVLQEGAGSP